MNKILLSIALTSVSYNGFGNGSSDELLSKTRQLTFEGARAGEGYFSQSGQKLVYQSENHAGNPFYQIYLLNLQTGENKIVSTGLGKTTCAWIHPNETWVLFSSTHLDPNASKKQTAELAERESGKTRKYSWDYDRHYDLFNIDTSSGKSTRLTSAEGYDAEGSYSPTGDKIVFASNRNAYSKQLTANEKEIFERDKSYFNDIFLMNSDGTGVQQLTHTAGYDGGPFFNSRGDQICWRRFSQNGHKAEIFRMNLETKQEKKLTELDAMSWAPYFHPSNKYLIFSTNLHGFNNFELYVVDIDGEKQPVRVTEADGFDGLPCFSPDGNMLSWTSNRTNDKKSQIFMANWNHQEMLDRLDLAQPSEETVNPEKALSSAKTTSPEVETEDIRKHLKYLCSDKLGGRLTGSPGNKKASAYVAESFKSYGMESFSKEDGWFQEFPFFNSAELSPTCKLDLSGIAGAKKEHLKIKKDWVPMSFSDSGNSTISEIVFAGYGIRAKKSGKWQEYDSYTHLDVKDKWVMVMRKLPTDWTEKRKDFFYHHSTFRKKATVARDLGAKGIIFVSDFAEPKDKPIEFSSGTTNETMSIQSIMITRSLAVRIFKAQGRDLRKVCDQLSTGELQMGFQLKKAVLNLTVSILRKKGVGRNTLGWLRANAGSRSERIIVIGAHLDHIGYGRASSRAKKSDKGKMHPGADDNASGIGALLEIAEYLADLMKKGLLKSNYDILIVAWSGEEMGLLGSAHFMRTQVSGKKNTKERKIISYLNLDMVGRYKDKLTLHGVGSSPAWKKLIQRANIPVGLNLNLQNDSHIPTDTTSFFTKGVPILSAFTGLHADYHSPSDTPDKINYDAVADCAKLYVRLIEGVVSLDNMDYVAQAPPPKSRGKLRVYLGTIPDYSQTDRKGLFLSGVSKGGPADLAGLQTEDLVIELGGKKVETIYDYTDAISSLKAGQESKVRIIRKGKTLQLKITPSAR
jgi:Tol biopolymer transport system component